MWIGVPARLRMLVRAAFGGGKMSANPDLFAKIQDGDEDALAEFLMLHVRPGLLCLVTKRSPGLQAADLEDLQADWLCKALCWFRSHKGQLPKPASRLARFFLVMGDHQLTDRLRRERRRHPQGDGLLLELTTGVEDFREFPWFSLMTRLRAIPRDGLGPSMVRAYDTVVELIDDRMCWPSTSELADRLGLSLPRASRLKIRIQFWIRCHLAVE